MARLSGFVPAGLGESKAQEALLNLHSTLKFGDLWKSIQELFETVVPHDTLVMSANYVDWRSECSKRRFSSARSRRPHHETDDRMVIVDGSTFFQPFLDARPGIQAYRHSQIIDDPKIVAATPFYRHYMRPNGWRHSAHLLFWKGGSVETSFALRRRGDQGDFSDEEMEALQLLHPHLRVAFDRIRIFEEERQCRRLLENFYRARSGAVLYLDWNLQMLYASQEALDLCASIRLGGDARRYNSRAVFEIPAEALIACERLRTDWLDVSFRNNREEGRAPQQSLSFSLPGLEAVITLRPEKRGTLTKPVFEIRMSAVAGDPLSLPDESRSREELTPGEKELAALVCKGWSNKDIATHMSKTEGTVKVQLSGIFRKLRVHSRTQLMVVMGARP